jgi:serine/threonine protein phosphatase PrpC
MLKVKDTLRATVHLAFDGRVVKSFHGPNAAERYANEVRVLRHLGLQDCPFVPRLLEAEADKLRIVTSNCGRRVEHLDEARRRELFAALERFGVRHDDPDIRNVTYRPTDGQFCLIDFEFATLLTAPTAALRPAIAHTLNWSAYSDRGKVRRNNEDAWLGLRFDGREVQHLGPASRATTAEADFVFAVSDGLGGAKSGEYASRIAVEKITRLLPHSFRLGAAGMRAGCADVLTELFTQVHRQLVYLGRSYDECADMETTLSLGWFTPGWMHFGHIGDSRIYYLPAGENKIRQLSQDDTHVGWLFRQGQLNEREARQHPRRNVLQKALGGGNQFVDPQVGAVACESGDCFLLCSDGLTEGLYDEQLTECLRAANAATPKENTAQRLVAKSLANDGRDNTTALVIQLL